MWWIGVDIGGTFTDAVAYDDVEKNFVFAKLSSTPRDPTEGVMDVLDELGLDLGNVQRFVHGLTIGTNAILEGKGADAWMMVTKGFRDVLEIARTNRPTLYDIKTLKQPPVLPRSRTLEIIERLLWDGSVRTELDEGSVRNAIERLSEIGKKDALCICFLHSYANPAHERRVREIVQKKLPDWYVSISSDVLPQFREYERFNTTALNTYIGPLIERYLHRLRSLLVERGYRQSVFITTSNGGVSTAERAKALPISTVLSGPAGGVAAAVHLGRSVGIKNMITCDMGGTSTDVCLIENLAVPVTDQQFIGGYANRTPQIAITTVGAGGGSVAWIDSGDILTVGPRSAGADPGPACYDRGGTEPTVTDANLLLQRLNPSHRLAGGIKLDEKRSLAAARALGTALGDMNPHHLAEGIVRIAVVRMVSAIKQISVSNGHDPRDFTLVAFGGAGPMHAAAIAEELEMTSILIPVAPGNFCAFGSLVSDIRRDLAVTKTTQINKVDFAEIDRMFKTIEAKALAELEAEAFDSKVFHTERSLGMRYLGQSWELLVELAPDVTDLAELQKAFASTHEKRFGHTASDPVEIVTYRVTAICPVTKPDFPRLLASSAAHEMLAVKGAVEDLATIVVGHKFAAGCAPQRLSFVGKPGAGIVWRWHQIPRATVDRDFEDSSGDPRPIYDRFIVPGQKSGVLTQLGNAQRAEIARDLLDQRSDGRSVDTDPRLCPRAIGRRNNAADHLRCPQRIPVRSGRPHSHRAQHHPARGDVA
jgi:N-methylhydantoinase A